MMLTGERLTLSLVGFFSGVTPAYKPLAKWLGICNGDGEAPQLSCLGDSSSPGVVRFDRSHREIRYREVLCALTHAAS
jgi:hypothetical protein